MQKKEINKIFDEALEKNQNDIVVVSDLLSKDDELEKAIIDETESSFKEVETELNADNSLYYYMRQISKHNLLTKEEELELGRRYFENHDMAARNKLIESNLRLVMKNAMKYKGRGVDLFDLIQEGNIGLVKAANKFDYRKGYRFTTYANWWVLQGIRHLVMQGKADVIAVPAYIKRKYKTIQTYIDKFNAENKRNPTNEEIAEATGFSARNIKKILSTPSCSLTLDSSIGDSSEDTFSDLAVDVDDISTENQIEQQFVQTSVNEVIDKFLDERESFVVKLYYGFGGNEKCSLQEIGNRLNITRERVRQIRNAALEKLNKEADINLNELK